MFRGVISFVDDHGPDAIECRTVRYRLVARSPETPRAGALSDR